MKLSAPHVQRHTDTTYTDMRIKVQRRHVKRCQRGAEAAHMLAQVLFAHLEQGAEVPRRARTLGSRSPIRSR